MSKADWSNITRDNWSQVDIISTEEFERRYPGDSEGLIETLNYVADQDHSQVHLVVDEYNQSGCNSILTASDNHTGLGLVTFVLSTKDYKGIWDRASQHMFVALPQPDGKGMSNEIVEKYRVAYTEDPLSTRIFNTPDRPAKHLTRLVDNYTTGQDFSDTKIGDAAPTLEFSALTKAMMEALSREVKTQGLEPSWPDSLPIDVGRIGKHSGMSSRL